MTSSNGSSHGHDMKSPTKDKEIAFPDRDAHCFHSTKESAAFVVRVNIKKKERGLRLEG
jgi:hypothetical protein